jgi:hypothetical protein
MSNYTYTECDTPTFLTVPVKVYEGRKTTTIPHLQGGDMIKRYTKHSMTRKWWHNKGRWILLVMAIGSCMLVDAHITAQAKQHIWSEYYMDHITHDEYCARLRELNR